MKKGKIGLSGEDKVQEQIQNYHFCTENSPLAKGKDEKKLTSEEVKNMQEQTLVFMEGI